MLLPFQFMELFRLNLHNIALQCFVPMPRISLVVVDLRLGVETQVFVMNEWT